MSSSGGVPQQLSCNSDCTKKKVPSPIEGLGEIEILVQTPSYKPVRTKAMPLRQNQEVPDMGTVPITRRLRRVQTRTNRPQSSNHGAAERVQLPSPQTNKRANKGRPAGQATRRTSAGTEMGQESVRQDSEPRNLPWARTSEYDPEYEEIGEAAGDPMPVPSDCSFERWVALAMSNVRGDKAEKGTQDLFTTRLIFFHAQDPLHNFHPYFLQTRWNVLQIRTKQYRRERLTELEDHFLRAYCEGQETQNIFSRREDYIRYWKSTPEDHHLLTKEEKRKVKEILEEAIKGLEDLKRQGVLPKFDPSSRPGQEMEQLKIFKRRSIATARLLGKYADPKTPPSPDGFPASSLSKRTAHTFNATQEDVEWAAERAKTREKLRKRHKKKRMTNLREAKASKDDTSDEGSSSATSCSDENRSGDEHRESTHGQKRRARQISKHDPDDGFSKAFSTAMGSFFEASLVDKLEMLSLNE